MAHANSQGHHLVPNEATQRLGLVVDKVGLDQLLQVGRTGFTSWRGLPTELVSFPVADLTSVAVLSWRWDVAWPAQYPWEPRPTYSRNILSALIYAKQAGIRHLFVDVVSIDQHLRGDDLMQQVLDFTTLYRFIPVIAAYDTISEDQAAITLRRPWISFEIQAYRDNPTSVTCVKWRKTHIGYDEPSQPDNDSGEQALRFMHSLRHVWRGSFSLTVALLLDGEIDMACIGDLKYILPEYAPVFQAAENMKLSRSDFILTAAILVQADLGTGPFHRDFTDPTIRIASAAPLKYIASSNRDCGRWYAFQAIQGEFGGVLEHVEVSVRSASVARWTAIDVLGLFESYVLASCPGAERVICCALGMTDCQYEAFLKYKVEVKSRIRPPDQSYSAGPKVKVREITLDRKLGH